MSGHGRRPPVARQGGIRALAAAASEEKEPGDEDVLELSLLRGRRREEGGGWSETVVEAAESSSTAMAIAVVVPATAAPGRPFAVRQGRIRALVTCPPDAEPGDVLEVAFHRGKARVAVARQQQEKPASLAVDDDPALAAPSGIRGLFPSLSPPVAATRQLLPTALDDLDRLIADIGTGVCELEARLTIGQNFQPASLPLDRLSLRSLSYKHSAARLRSWVGRPSEVKRSKKLSERENFIVDRLKTAHQLLKCARMEKRGSDFVDAVRGRDEVSRLVQEAGDELLALKVEPGKKSRKKSRRASCAEPADDGFDERLSLLRETVRKAEATRAMWAIAHVDEALLVQLKDVQKMIEAIKRCIVDDIDPAAVDAAIDICRDLLRNAEGVRRGYKFRLRRLEDCIDLGTRLRPRYEALEEGLGALAEELNRLMVQQRSSQNRDDGKKAADTPRRSDDEAGAVASAMGQLRRLSDYCGTQFDFGGESRFSRAWEGLKNNAPQALRTSKRDPRKESDVKVTDTFQEDGNCADVDKEKNRLASKDDGAGECDGGVYSSEEQVEHDIRGFVLGGSRRNGYSWDSFEEEEGGDGPSSLAIEKSNDWREAEEDGAAAEDDDEKKKQAAEEVDERAPRPGPFSSWKQEGQDGSSHDEIAPDLGSPSGACSNQNSRGSEPKAEFTVRDDSLITTDTDSPAAAWSQLSKALHDRGIGHARQLALAAMGDAEAPTLNSAVQNGHYGSTSRAHNDRRHSRPCGGSNRNQGSSNWSKASSERLSCGQSRRVRPTQPDRSISCSSVVGRHGSSRRRSDKFRRSGIVASRDSGSTRSAISSDRLETSSAESTCKHMGHVLQSQPDHTLGGRALESSADRQRPDKSCQRFLRNSRAAQDASPRRGANSSPHSLKRFAIVGIPIEELEAETTNRSHSTMSKNNYGPVVDARKIEGTNDGADIRLSYGKDGWERMLQLSDLYGEMSFQWVRFDSEGAAEPVPDRFDLVKSAYIRDLSRCDDVSTDVDISLVPAWEYRVPASILDCDGDELVSPTDISRAQAMQFDQKVRWFEEKCQQLRYNWERGHIQVRVRRSNLLEDSVDLFKSLGQEDFRKIWQVQFIDEPGLDAGGLSREWFQLLSSEIFDPDTGLFRCSQTNQMAFEADPSSSKLLTLSLRFVSLLPRKADKNLVRLCYFKVHWGTDTFSGSNLYRFAGQVLGKAIFDGQLVVGHFVQYIYKHMLGWPVTFKDLKGIDSEYHLHLERLLEMAEAGEDLSALCITFCVTNDLDGSMREVELIEGGANVLVSSDNIPEYLELCLRYRTLESTRQQLAQLVHGFCEVIPEPLLTIFDFQELELLLCGLPEIDIDDWKANTEYTGLYEQDGEGHPSCMWFWDVIEEFDHEMRARFLQYVTGTAGCPPRGFGILRGRHGEIQKFTINGVGFETSFYPRAHTCFNRIDLPYYESKEELGNKLKMAVTLAGTGFDLE